MKNNNVLITYNAAKAIVSDSRNFMRMKQAASWLEHWAAPLLSLMPEQVEKILFITAFGLPPIR